MQRVALVCALCVACGGKHRFSPAVIPNLSEMPTDTDRRDRLLDSSLARPGPENKPATRRGRKIETFAATAAAALGLIFSKSKNVSWGFQLNQEVDVHHPTPVEGGDGDGTGSGSGSAPKPPADAGELVPWVHLK